MIDAAHRPDVATALLAALSVTLFAAATAVTGWYREGWVWENPLQAVTGVALAMAGTAGSLLLALQAPRGRLTSRLAIGLASLCLGLVAVGCLLFIRSGATVLPVLIAP